jgi:glycosyltransferase involved in cell wall biosynthesis
VKILMLTQFYAPVIGGEERMVEDLSAELVERGHTVAVATLRQAREASDAGATENEGPVRVHRIPSFTGKIDRLFTERERHHAPPVPDPGIVSHLRRIIAAERPDILHAHNWIVYSYLPLKHGDAPPLVLSLHDHSLRCATKRLMRNGVVPCDGPGLTRCIVCTRKHYGLTGPPIALALKGVAPFLRRSVDLFLPVSRTVADQAGLPGSGVRFEVISNFVPDAPPANRAADAELLARLPRSDFVLFVGDMTRDKGIDVLFRAYENLEVDAPLVVIGRRVPGEFDGRTANATILGACDHATVLEAMRRCALLVAPSVLPEAFGLVALEAMSVGRPVVAAASGGLEDIVAHGETGLLVPPANPALLQGAITRLLRDAPLRSRMSKAALRRSRAFTASAVVPRVEHAYRSLLAERGRRRRGPWHSG